MIFNYKKYKSISDFVNNVAKSKNNEAYTIIHKCHGAKVVGQTCEFNDNCFGCLFCAMYNEECLQAFKAYRGQSFISVSGEASFKLKPVTGPKPLNGIKHPYMSLEKFTGVDETTNIQPWAACLFDKMSSAESRVSMEIPVFNSGYDRNGRLDIGIISGNYFLAIESKISLDDALKDERFIEQHEKYTVEIEKATSSYTYLTLFGGKETDLFPPSSEYCTGKIGDKTKRFYEMIDKNSIQFITANALWCLCCKYIEEGNTYCWDNILINIFNNPDCVGLCSAGKIIKTKKGYCIEEI